MHGKQKFSQKNLEVVIMFGFKTEFDKQFNYCDEMENQKQAVYYMILTSIILRQGK